MYEFGICLDDQVIEHASCWSLKPDAYVHDVYIAANFCGQGLAKKPYLPNIECPNIVNYRVLTKLSF